MTPFLVVSSSYDVYFLSLRWIVLETTVDAAISKVVYGRPHKPRTKNKSKLVDHLPSTSVSVRLSTIDQGNMIHRYDGPVCKSALGAFAVGNRR